jgi:hypothetical protein
MAATVAWTAATPLALGAAAPAQASPLVVPRGAAVVHQVDTSTNDPLRVVIDRIAPSVVPTSGDLRVSGTIRNTSDEQWRDLTVYLLTSFAPITTESDLAEAVASDPRNEVGSRIVDPGLFVSVGDLDPGQRTRFHLAVPRSKLGISGAPGVYWLGVHVLGTNTLGRDTSADGRARTFLPLVPRRHPGTQLALGEQFRDHVVRGADGRLELSGNWQAAVAPGGRLDRLLRLDRSAPSSWPLTWVVDPAVVDAVTSLAQGNPPLHLGEAPHQAGSPEARDWLQRFTKGARRRSVLALPYADLDVSAAIRAGRSDLIDKAWRRSLDQLRSVSVSASPALAPVGGMLSREAYSAVPQNTPVLLTPDVVAGAPSGQLLSRPGGGGVMLTPPGSDLVGPGPSAPRSALSLRQQLLADAALHALSRDRNRPLVRLLPPGWDPGTGWRAAQFFHGLSVPWLSGADLAGILTASPARATVDANQISYPAEAQETEIPSTLLRATEGVISSAVPIQELVGEPSVTAQLTSVGLTGSSVLSRPHPGFATARMRGARQVAHGWLQKIAVNGPSFVTMSSETGTFQVTLVNGLSEPVTVGLQATVPGGQLQLSDVKPIRLEPHSRGPVRIEARAHGIGVHEVRLQPVSTEGTRVGQPMRISVRSSRVGFILWVIMGIAAAVLFVAIVLRIARRLRARRRTHGPLLGRGP